MPDNTDYTWERDPFLQSYPCKSKGCARDWYKNGVQRRMVALRVTPERSYYMSLIYMCEHCKVIKLVG